MQIKAKLFSDLAQDLNFLEIPCEHTRSYNGDIFENVVAFIIFKPTSHFRDNMPNLPFIFKLLLGGVLSMKSRRLHNNKEQ